MQTVTETVPTVPHHGVDVRGMSVVFSHYLCYLYFVEPCATVGMHACHSLQGDWCNAFADIQGIGALLLLTVRRLTPSVPVHIQ